MITSLRKGTSHFFISYTDGDHSSNLYCSDMKYIDDNEKIILLDFHKLFNSHSQTNSKDDLNDLSNKIEFISEIQFRDSQVSNLLSKKLNQNEKVSVKFLIGILKEKKMRIIFKSNDKFNLVDGD